MKKLLLGLTVFLIGLSLTAGNASAWYFELDNSDNDLTFDILFNPEGDVTVLNYQLDFKYDTAELANWTNAGGSYTITPLEGLFPDFMGVMTETDYLGNSTPGQLRNFNAAKMGAPANVSGNSGILIGTVTFGSLLPGTTMDGSVDFAFEETYTIVGTVNGVSHYLKYADNTIRDGDGLDLGDPSTTLPGDINDDDIVDLTDVMLTLQIATGLTPTAPNMDADVNGDGKIGAEESIYVVQMVADLR